ncbi:MAG TPA: hypothetical protein VHV30_12465 [Polyangiaceae bacterium]|jgi:hypothetical protein|nr:hypothetical protein [Polyangiaceae bacterium]
MSAPTFNPAQAVRFDLAHGAVRAGTADDRFVLVPASALVDVARGAPAEVAAALGQAIGRGIGRRAAGRIGDAKASTLEGFITQLAGEAAIAGVGLWSLERWGRALVVVVSEGVAPPSMIAAIVGAAIEGASGRKVGCALLAGDEHGARVLVSSDRAVERVRQWIGSGMAWAEAISKLHGGGS